MQIENEIRAIAKKYSDGLNRAVSMRLKEMKEDDTAHYLLYGALGISHEEGEMIDVYQNKGRFLYRYAGSFLEEAAKICIKSKYPTSKTTKIANTLGGRPKTFEIDMLIEDKLAVEIKWRDATTDGDHITKEHTRMQCISDAGYTPVRVMFYEPNRGQAQKIQSKLKGLYLKQNGQYHSGDDAWNWIKDFTGTDLFGILTRMENEVSLNV